jgi:hypothetical protein
MKKSIGLLAIVLLLTSVLVGCSKGPVDGAMNKFKQSIKNLEAAIKSGDEKKIDAAADEFEKAGQELGKYENKMTDLQKLEMAKVSLEASAVLLQAYGSGFTDDLKDALSGLKTE